jgi:DNA integrity scanning protein DisA with diadenylate cyclase activity
MIEVVASCFLEIGKVDGIIHMRQGVKIAKANLHRIPARKIVTHVALPFSN